LNISIAQQVQFLIYCGYVVTLAIELYGKGSGGFEIGLAGKSDFFS
jgi:hypothetical protein